MIAIALFVILLIGALGAAGIYFGLSDRAKVEKQVAREHYQKGVVHMNEGDLELAIAEFELVLQLDPQSQDALGSLSEVRRQLEVKPSPTPMLQQETKAAFFGEISAAYAESDWEEVFGTSDRLLALDPAYQREAVDAMLFEAFRASGLESIEQNRMKEGLRLLERAQALRPDDAQVAHARNLADLYLTAMSYWGADWAKAIANLEALHRLDPNYLDTPQRISDACVSFGDLLTESQQHCEAEAQYSKALAVMPDEQVSARREKSLEDCSQLPAQPNATGTPDAEEPEEPDAPSGTFAGRLVERTGITESKLYIRGKVYDKSGKGIQSVRVKIQAWDWSAVAVTDGSGQYAFDGLSNAVTYTLSMIDLPSVPFDVAGVWGKISWVDFREAK